MNVLGLLERDAALSALARARARAAAGRGRVALVCGEAGIGKTSLLARFTASLAPDEVACGHCDSLFTPRVLGPVHDIAAARGGALLERLESGASRVAIFSAFLEDLRRRPGSVTVFEDVHWADEATLDLVKYAARRIAAAPALIVLTFRADEVHARHPLRLVLGELPRAHCERIELAALSPAAVAELARAAQRDGDPTDLYAATGGNPFFVTEVLAAGGGDVPASVRDAVLARAGRLAAAAREAADLLSTEPLGMEPWLARACGATDAALAECEERGIVRSDNDVLRFRHEIARLAIHESMPAARARALHRTVLAALRAKPAAGMEARLAHHAEAADEGEAVAQYSIAAARRAGPLGAHREAADHYARAVRFAGAMPDRERAAILDAYAWECHVTARFEASARAREAAIALWKRLGDREREAESRGRLAHLLIVAGRNPESAVAMRDALALANRVPDSAATMRVRTMHAYLLMLERDIEASIAEGLAALALAERLGDMDTVIHVENTIGAAMLVNDDDRGVAHLERSLALAREHGQDAHVAGAYGNLGSAAGEVYRIPEAKRWLEEGVAYAARHDLDNSRFYQLSWLALARLYLGQWTEAAEAAQTVLASPGAQVIARIMALLTMGRLRARRGDPGTWQALDEALALSDATQTLQRLAPVRAARAEAAWLDGEDGAAAREAAACLDLALAKKHAWFTGELGYWCWKGGGADASSALGASPFALQVQGRWREAAAEWRRRQCPYEEARALAEGDTDARLEALRIFTGLGARPAAERLRQSLRNAGVRRIPRGPRPSTRAHPSGLTDRELEIVALVGQGLTNAEIAARLHISAKTVDHHVSAVLGKLGVDSRRAAAKALAALAPEAAAALPK